MKVFVTGATGFLGYHIARVCVEKGYDVICLRRKSSVSMFDTEIESCIQWVDLEQQQDLKKLEVFAPEVLIHAAWGGVTAGDRNNKDIQIANTLMTDKLMRICAYKQIIMLGSQDEYGNINSVVSENHPMNPISEYAKAKVLCLKRLKNYCDQHQIEWQWIRIFSIYGEKQQSQWLIPSTVIKCLKGEKSMLTTKGEQVYSYLYSSDLAYAIASIIGKQGKSGIYNISSGFPVSIRELQEKIKNLTNSNIVFDRSLSYRPHQSMIMMGDSSKFINTFGKFEKTNLESGLACVIKEITDRSLKDM